MVGTQPAGFLQDGHLSVAALKAVIEDSTVQDFGGDSAQKIEHHLAKCELCQGVQDQMMRDYVAVITSALWP